MELDYEHPRIDLINKDKPLKAKTIEEQDHGYLKVVVSDDEEEWADHEEIIVGPAGVIRIYEEYNYNN